MTRGRGSASGRRPQRSACRTGPREHRARPGCLRAEFRNAARVLEDGEAERRFLALVSRQSPALALVKPSGASCAARGPEPEAPELAAGGLGERRLHQERRGATALPGASDEKLPEIYNACGRTLRLDCCRKRKRDVTDRFAPRLCEQAPDVRSRKRLCESARDFRPLLGGRPVGRCPRAIAVEGLGEGHGDGSRVSWASAAGANRPLFDAVGVVNAPLRFCSHCGGRQAQSPPVRAAGAASPAAARASARST